MIAQLTARVRDLLGVLAPLGPGSRALALRLVDRFGWGPALGGVVVALYTAARYRTWIAWGLLAWCALAWAHAPADGPEEEPAEDAEQTDPHPPVGLDPEDVVDVVRDVMGAGRGALLTALVGPLGVADTRAVRQLLAAADIPVREGVRTAAGNGPGVHRDDVPAPRSVPADAPVGDVAAGESANTNANNSLRVEAREGMTIITDPADAHRAHDLRKT